MIDRKRDFTIKGKYLITYYDSGYCIERVREIYTEISEVRKQINKNQTFLQCIINYFKDNK